jgi:hypothetical protein
VRFLHPDDLTKDRSLHRGRPYTLGTSPSDHELTSFRGQVLTGVNLVLYVQASYIDLPAVQIPPQIPFTQLRLKYTPPAPISHTSHVHSPARTRRQFPRYEFLHLTLLE